MKLDKKILKKPFFYFMLLLLIVLGFFIFQLIRLAVIPQGYMMILLAVLILLYVLSCFLLLHHDGGKIQRVFGTAIAVILAVICGFGSFYLNATYDSLSMMSSSQSHVKKTTCLYVLNSSGIEDARDMDNDTIGIMKNFEGSKGASGISKQLYGKGTKAEYKKYDSVIRMVKDLKGQAIDGIIMDSSYISTLEDFEEEKDIRQQLNPILEYKYYVDQKEKKVENTDVTHKPFSVFISGIDTYGQIEETSRSDVNMVAVIHPKKKNILLVSIPRDYYVETYCEKSAGCAIGEMDKLTHTGLHGVETTQMTVENLLKMNIDYHARVNFSSVVQIVDELGGIDVVNPNTFDCGQYHFEAGKDPIHLNGDQALAFCRERYSFMEGDRERGRNQMRVVNGMVQKLTSPQILKNFSGIMNAVGHSFQTNMSVEDMTALVQMQLSEGGSWHIYSCSLNGTGGTDFAYELGDNASVMYPDKYTITKAKENIDAIMYGDIPPYAVTN